jgi:hypothetical protein
MPKYYVCIIDHKYTVVAETPQKALLKAIEGCNAQELGLLGMVSERGFGGEHEDDIYISIPHVLEEAGLWNDESSADELFNDLIGEDFPELLEGEDE